MLDPPADDPFVVQLKAVLTEAEAVTAEMSKTLRDLLTLIVVVRELLALIQPRN